GRGGIDRLNDLIFEAIAARSELNICLDRLVTRGQRGLFAAQFVFSFALLRLVFSGLRGKVDVLHIHLSDKGSCYRKTLLGAFARFLRIPYVVHLHGAVFSEFWSTARPSLARAIDRLFERSAHIIVLGRHWAAVVGDRLPTVVHKISIIPNATPRSLLNQVPAKDGRIRITYLGELGPRKGTTQLIEALGRLDQRSDWTATIAGNGKLDESREAVRRLGIADRVEIPGWLDSAATNYLLCRTDVLALPSFSENLPMVILEAFAHGVVVVSTPVGAIPEVIDHGGNGFLVPCGDVLALADTLGQLIKNSELRQKVGQAARRSHTEHYDIGSYVSKLVSIWEQLGGSMPASFGKASHGNLKKLNDGHVSAAQRY